MATNLNKAHEWMKERLNQEESLVIDMTCGNGYDTLFLANHAKHVTAIDLQEDAINNTKLRTKHCENVTYILADHSTLEFSTVHGAIYNLGYLPHGDKSITTQTQSTLTSLSNLCPHLLSFLVITCYPGHQGGLEETEAVMAFINKLDKPITVFRYDKPLSPITFCIDFET